MNFCLPSDLEKEVHGMAFQSRLGEFALYAFQPSDMARREDLFTESLQLLTESKMHAESCWCPMKGNMEKLWSGWRQR